MDDDRPLFSTFKPIGEDNTASTKPGPDTTPVQPQGAEQPPGHRDTDGGVPPGSWPSPPSSSPPEEDPRPELVALRAQTRLWFEQTQARRLGAKGELPVWFHGFISRRETEQLLQDRPPGCFLVRFSESTVGFVLSYRGRDRCRHFVLDQLPDGRYVILGERSAHAELADLLRHYAAAPVAPYHEFLTVPCEREGEPQGGTWIPAGSDAARSPSSEAPANVPVYSTATKGSPAARQAATAPPLPAEPSARGGSSREVKEGLSQGQKPQPGQSSREAEGCSRDGDAAPATTDPCRTHFQPLTSDPSPLFSQAPRVPPPLPAKASSSAAAQGPHSPVGGGAAPEGPYARVHKEAVPPEPPTPPQPADAKYQQLMCFHTYAEPHEGIAPGPSTYYELEEPIPFYAMGRGLSPSAGPEENIYSEVALARQDLPAPLPRGVRGSFSTLPPKSPAHRRLFRSMSSQASKRRQLPAAPTADGKERGASGPAAAVRSPEQVVVTGGEGGSPAQGSVLERRSPTHSQSGSEVEGWEGEGPTLNHVLALKSNLHPVRHNLTAVSLHLSPRVPQGTTTNPPLEFDDPVYSRRTSTAKQAAAAAGPREHLRAAFWRPSLSHPRR
ncbi:hypothetical protein QYF61_023643 [Mycteria americana]|uniref:SH2 domain-containing protein n=1 Tax=Mycteria americana TaxID=33587 RepID=A0AAN7MJI4_MYCAM|nr:hypothetical protein QYF61_023643 [Mycteria americana]